jgi:Ubiquitin 3 binding protein But2 C-terminal domain
MKGIFSVATLLSVLATLAAAAPLTPRGVPIYSKGADFIRVTNEAQPNSDETSVFGLHEGYISRTNGIEEHASYLSFAIPPITSIPGASASSTCSLVIRYPGSATGSGYTQLYSLGGPIDETTPLTFYSHPYHNQYLGTYAVTEGDESTAIDVQTIPCTFNGKMQYVLRPQNDNDYIQWDQDNVNGIGAFIVVSN